jgi:hypothetical protein
MHGVDSGRVRITQMRYQRVGLAAIYMHATCMRCSCVAAIYRTGMRAALFTGCNPCDAYMRVSIHMSHAVRNVKPHVILHACTWHAVLTLR